MVHQGLAEVVREIHENMDRTIGKNYLLSQRLAMLDDSIWQGIERSLSIPGAL